MNFGLTFEKLLLIGLIAALLIGPERLPAYAAGLRRLVDRAKVLLRSAEGRLKDELGPEFTETDWRQLDPRRFDPRRIVREALLADPVAPTITPPAPAAPAPVATISTGTTDASAGIAPENQKRDAAA